MHIGGSRDDRMLCKSSNDYTDTFLSQARPKEGQGSYHHIPSNCPWSRLLGMSWKCLGTRYVPGRTECDDADLTGGGGEAWPSRHVAIAISRCRTLMGLEPLFGLVETTPRHLGKIC